MPTKEGHGRPKAGHGLGSAMTPETTKAKRVRVESSKPARNRNRVVPATPNKRRSR